MQEVCLKMQDIAIIKTLVFEKVLVSILRDQPKKLVGVKNTYEQHLEFSNLGLMS